MHEIFLYAYLKPLKCAIKKFINLLKCPKRVLMID